MRLICPNCDAQYEVPAEVMPQDGRDVQCSNCGQTWFQEHPDRPLENAGIGDTDALEDEEVEPAAAAITPEPEPEPAEPMIAPETVPHEDIAERSENSFQSDHDTFQSDHDTPGQQDEQPQRRELDPAVADVLRAEAELEAEARRSETGSIESQPDLGLPEVSDDASLRAREARERMARMRGEPVEFEDAEEEELLPAASAALASRRDLLPDIEEINSTLRSNNDRSATADAGQTAQVEYQEKRSSRLGFSLTVALVAILALIYVFSPKLIETIPQAEPILSSYAAMVDGWRVWLDAQVEAALNWLDEAAVSSGQ